MIRKEGLTQEFLPCFELRLLPPAIELTICYAFTIRYLWDEVRGGAVLKRKS